jgi:hypothetical protein
MIDAYQIIAENADDPSNQKERVVPDLPATALLVDYLRAALVVSW